MRFFTRPLMEEHIRDIAGWRYAAPYDVYNDCAGGLDASFCRVLLGADGALLGYFCWGGECRVADAGDVYEAEPIALDFGIGIKPEYTGVGIGMFVCQHALEWLRAEFSPPAFRLAVYEWNTRARGVYERLGFQVQTGRGELLIMRLEERPFRNATRPLENGMRVYPADPGFERHLHYRKENCGWDMSVFSMAAHTGTHIDAPAHIGLAGGTDLVSLDWLNGAAQVLDFTRPDLALVRAPRVLLKTGGRGITTAEAEGLLSLGVRLVGTDALSIGEGEAEMPVHRLLLEAGVIILENAALEDFSPGWYEMRCLPLLMPGSDGAPVRLLLREESR